MSVLFYFKKWKFNVECIKYDKWCIEYDKWCEIHEEEISEKNYAQENNMDSIHWCWECKYGDCQIHFKN